MRAAPTQTRTRARDSDARNSRVDSLQRYEDYEVYVEEYEAWKVEAIEGSQEYCAEASPVLVPTPARVADARRRQRKDVWMSL